MKTYHIGIMMGFIALLGAGCDVGPTDEAALSEQSAAETLPFLGDLDSDGIPNAQDPDADGDGIDNVDDNCAIMPNPDQGDLDGDMEGDICDGDVDGDGFQNRGDNCPVVPNVDQKDSDQDGQGDACDGAASGGQPSDPQPPCQEMKKLSDIQGRAVALHFGLRADDFLANDVQKMQQNNPAYGLFEVAKGEATFLIHAKRKSPDAQHQKDIRLALYRVRASGDLCLLKRANGLEEAEMSLRTELGGKYALELSTPTPSEKQIYMLLALTCSKGKCLQSP